MSKEALAKVVQRAISDGAFRRQLSSDPATALRGFDLSPDESAAIRSGDAGRLTAMGVELRMSKAFTLSSDQATGDAVRPVLSNDLGASFTGAMNAGVNSAGNAALISGVNSAGNSALLSGVNSAGNASLDAGMNSAAGNAALISGVNASDAILTDDSAATGQAAVIPGGPDHALGALTGGEGASAVGALDDANAEGFLTSVHTINEGSINQVAITTESAGASSALTGGANAAGNASLTDANEGYLTSVHTGGDNATNDVLVVDDNGVSGAASPGEASDGPTLSQ